MKNILCLNPSLATPYAQLSHTVLGTIWSVIGVWKLSKGLPVMGPTASVTAIGIILALSGLIIVSVRKSAALYLDASGLLFLLLRRLFVAGSPNTLHFGHQRFGVMLASW